MSMPSGSRAVSAAPISVPEQHGAGRLDGQRRDDERVGRQRGHRPLGADDRRLRLQQVRAGLDDQRVGAAAEQAGRVLVVGVAELAEGDVAERRQLGARADRADHPAQPPVGGGELVGRLAGQPRARLRELADPLGYAILAEVGEVRAERVGRHAVRAGRQVRPVDVDDDVRPGRVQHLVAAFVALEVGQGRVAGLDHRAHRAVGDDDPRREGRPEGRGPLRSLFNHKTAHRCPDSRAFMMRPQ